MSKENGSEGTELSTLSARRENGEGGDPLQDLPQVDQTSSLTVIPSNDVSEDLFTGLEAYEDPPPSYDEALTISTRTDRNEIC